jgi:hypothetical protein
MTTKLSFRLMALAALAVVGGSSFAAQTWTNANLSNLCSPNVNTTSCGPGLSVSGYSTGTGTTNSPSTSTKFQNATVYDWGSGAGLGVVNSNENSSATGPHAVDNVNGIDALLLNFSTASNLSSLTVGWNGVSNPSGVYNDSDLSIFAWTGTSAPTVTSFGPSTLVAANSGWQMVGSWSNVTSTITTNSSTYSSYWLISAYDSAYGSWTVGNDAFKVLAISAKDCLAGNACTPPTPGTRVPEPGTLARLGAAMLGMVSTRRKFKSSRS